MTVRYSSVDAQLERIVSMLRAHFIAHPNAADTWEGIATWWLTDRCGGACRERVEQALQRLVDEGFVTGRRMANGKVIYALNKSR